MGYKVKLPYWWTEGEEVIGYTDKVDTYCCCTVRAWFVTVPAYDYEGYFNVRDLKEV